MADVKIDVKLDMPRILDKVENDEFGLFLAKDWMRLISPYVPRGNTDLLSLSASYEPFKITYWQPYSHYMYNGIVYVDPTYNVGGFTNDGGITFWSRPGIKKIPSGRKFNYSKDINPQATDHWDKAAEQAGQKKKLIEAANNYLRRIK